MKKKLKVNGSSIENFWIKLSSIDSIVDRISLKIEAEGRDYEYELSSDTRHPDIQRIISHLNSSLKEAQDKFLNIEISEFSDRNYLFFKVQKIGQEQYTGIRK